MLRMVSGLSGGWAKMFGLVGREGSGAVESS